MRISDFFFSLTALQKRIHHLSDDGPGADDRDLHHDVVEAYGPKARQAGHLRSAFDLEHSYGVGLLQGGIDLLVILWKMGEVNFFVIVIVDKFDGILEYGHHAESEQIDFDDAHVGAIFFVPLHDDAAGHRSRFERDDGIELSLADDHAAGVLAEMAGHVLHSEAEFVIFAQARVGEIKAGVAESTVERVVFVAEFPGGDCCGNFGECFGIESESLAHFTGSHAIAIGDDIGGHGGATLAIPLVNVLDNFFALVTAGKIEIDVGPLAALFRKKTFEEKFHADGIDGSDAERVTDSAIGGGAASLDKDVLLAAV